ncbi:hypothetical protein ABEB36_006632 [Hypothenemus hampei]|uniref:Uncharacterized protein n=1 Tax=Hypothenemus hampei TaxID=57062 RepID=A0ABD1ETG2_HYPHA
MSSLQLFCLVVFVSLSWARPQTNYYPRPYVIGGSFYSPPGYSGYRNFRQPGQMTAMVIGDTVATNSYSGSPYFGANGISRRQVVQEQITDKPETNLIVEPEVNEQETLFSIEEDTPETTIKPFTTTQAPSTTRKTKTGKAKKPFITPPPTPQPNTEQKEEEDDDEYSWPFSGSSKGYNAFFPIFIAGGRSKTRATEEGGFPGSATAIANAFSTGKGGVATSHATAFGDPYTAAMLRNSGFNVRTKNGRKLSTQDNEQE